MSSNEKSAEIKLCRICITNSQSSSMVSIFNDDQLWQQIKSFAEVEIIEGDHLPQQVCLSCADNVFKFYLFKKKCEQSDAFFRLELLKSLDYQYKPKPQTVYSNPQPPQQEIYDESCSSSDEDDLPLIPEIELVTPNEDEQSDSDSSDEDDSDSDGDMEMGMPMSSAAFTENQVDGHVVSYECSTCKKTYLNRRFMEKHVRRNRCMQKRKNQTRPMQCSTCQVVFPSGHHYGWHKRNGCPSNYNNLSTSSLDSQPHPSFLTPMTTPNPNNSLINSTPKTKGRNRIKLDAAMLNTAKILVMQGATTSQLGEHLKISRTFAWRLRKNILNGCMSPVPEDSPEIIPILSNDEEESIQQQPGCSKSIDKRKMRKFAKREKKKIRKPNVFINDEMYERAKGFIDQKMTTLEIARHLNISQMTAWKLRDAITRGIKLTFREKQPKKQQNINNTREWEKRVSLKKKIKAQERLERDKEISKEILEIVKQDMSIQYWKISEKLAEKGFILSTSSVCQKLKAMGIRRRFKCHEKQRQLEESGGIQNDNDDVNLNNNFIFKEEEANDEENLVNGGHFMSIGL